MDKETRYSVQAYLILAAGFAIQGVFLDPIFWFFCGVFSGLAVIYLVAGNLSKDG